VSGSGLGVWFGSAVRAHSDRLGITTPWRGISSIVHTCSGVSAWNGPEQKGRGTYVSIVTALFGTVLIRFTLNPLYNPDQPSLITIFFAV
jgi:hypothetical protein